MAVLSKLADVLVWTRSPSMVTDLVAGDIAVAPAKPGARRPDKVVVAEIGKRTLTTVADTDSPPP